MGALSTRAHQDWRRLGGQGGAQWRGPNPEERRAGPYRWWRAVGVRRTLGTHDLSFSGSAHGGVCMHFREPVWAARLSVTELYATVDDLIGLGDALTARGIAGQDLRVRL